MMVHSEEHIFGKLENNMGKKIKLKQERKNFGNIITGFKVFYKTSNKN